MFLGPFVSLGQSKDLIRFVPVYNGQKLTLNTTFNDGSDSYEFSTLRFYVTIPISSKESISDGIYLIDLEDSNSLIIPFKFDNKKSISFYLGIDSLTNVSGNLEGPLDPVKGMYWSWNSGYINFKLEGKSSKSNSPYKSFEYHLGGYLPPFSTLQIVDLSHNGRIEDVIEIELDLSIFLKEVLQKENHSIMVPGKDALDLSILLSKLFELPENDK